MITRLFDKRAGIWYDTDPHQQEAYTHLMANPRAALFLGMSLSKTAIALSYLYDMHYREAAILKTLVVAPDKVARITWPDELNKWAHLDGARYSVIAGSEKQRVAALEADAEIFIVGVDNLVWLLKRFIYQRISKQTGRPYGPWLGKLPFDSLVLDELSLFKGRDSSRFTWLTRALKNSDVEYRIGMTGTPAPNGFIDLWAQIHLLDDGQRLGETFGVYLDKYFKTRGNGMIVYEYIAKPNAEKVIAHKLRDIALSIQTRDVLKLPRLELIDEELTLDAFDRDTYDQLEAEYCIDLFTGGEVTVKTPADLTNKLLQVSSGAIYEDTTKNWVELNTVKLDALGALLDDYPDETFILVYQYRHEVERIIQRFPFARQLRKGKGTAEDFADWNAGRIRLLLIHPKGAGHGLNLQFGGRRMIWFSLTFNLEYWLQTVARLLRRGALKTIYIHRLIVKGTRDDKVKKRIYSKDSDQTFLLTEIKELRAKYGY